MARIRGPAGLRPYQVDLRDRCAYGDRIVWATSHDQAKRLILDQPSVFGLSESVRIWRVTELHIREQSILTPDEREHDRAA